MSDLREGVLLHVTMTPEAAERFRQALLRGSARMEIEGPGPSGTEDLQAHELSSWLRWGVSRIDCAREALRDGAG